MMVDDAMNLLREMVAVPSPSFEETAVRDLISGKLAEWGIQHQIIRNNIVCKSSGFSSSKKTLLLCAHIDTVPPAEEYVADPAIAPEDIICGLGSNDDGGSVVSMIQVFRHFKDEELPFNLVLTLTAEEERSGPDGMRYMWDNELRSYVDWAIVGEPTGMRAATSERGLLVIDGTAKGVSGHAARNEGVNALYIALDDIQALRSHKFSKVSPIMGDVHLNVTQINAGTAHNVIPDRCTFVVDVRPTEQYTNQELFDELQGICRSELKARNLSNCSSASNGDSALVKAVKELGIETFSSPTTSDWMRISCDAVKMGPGESSRSHKKNEFILRSEIADAIDKYIKLIRHYGNTLE